MPLNPTPVKLYGLINMNFLIDIFNFAGYYTVSLPTMFNSSNTDSMLNVGAAANEKEIKVTGKPIVNNGIKGLEYNEYVDGFKMKLHLFTQENIVYAAVMLALKPVMLQSPTAIRYFDSFKIKRQSNVAEKGNFIFVDSIMGLQLESPAQLTENNNSATMPMNHGILLHLPVPT